MNRRPPNLPSFPSRRPSGSRAKSRPAEAGRPAVGKHNADSKSAAAAKTAATRPKENEAQIAVHWKEEEYFQPSPKFIGQANLNDPAIVERSEEHTSELQSPCNLVCRLLLEKKKKLLSVIYIDRTMRPTIPLCHIL